jgi:hypothetical protein
VGLGGLAGAVALEAVDDGCDDDGGDEKFHGAKFALIAFLPRVADQTLCIKILPTTLASCSRRSPRS